MPQPFLDIAFPPFVARGASGGPTFATNIVTLASGAEQRNVLWANARGRWNISTGIRTRAQMLEVIAFFHVAKGRGFSFRFRDWNDFQATEVPMQEVTPTVWQLVKRYNVGGFEHVRTITKPLPGSVTIKIGGVPIVPTKIDHQSGRITFASAPDTAPTASFDFDVSVRFDTDSLPVQANAFDQQIVAQIDLVEVPE
ncbi:hypothetical protein BN961_03086 [Afipia felis]|uniref:DUF2460 domain-containing protein n=1 Tax=Afipia felis TaxID=1035 RepID=A0A090MQL1_AFIFE|nr:DUF2460 domain-containing protein [Afipia felis]CEG09656.1 hypothetical protein BN961_03086 [Afipia felis]